MTFHLPRHPDPQGKDTIAMNGDIRGLSTAGHAVRRCNAVVKRFSSVTRSVAAYSIGKTITYPCCVTLQR